MVYKNNLGNSIKYDVPTGWMMAAQFCQRAHISRTTLNRLKREGIVTPASMQSGKLTVWLYNETNLKEVWLYKRGYYKLKEIAEAG